MEMKTCVTCNTEKPIESFYNRSGRKNKTHSMCKMCFNSYCTDRWIKKKIDAIVYKGSKCIDCNLQYPNEPYVIFDFHHLDPQQKDFDWSKLRLMSNQKIIIELDKCDLLCSNCHRKRHHK
jgi:hypothetical protein